MDETYEAMIEACCDADKRHKEVSNFRHDLAERTPVHVLADTYRKYGDILDTDQAKDKIKI